MSLRDRLLAAKTVDELDRIRDEVHNAYAQNMSQGTFAKCLRAYGQRYQALA